MQASKILLGLALIGGALFYLNLALPPFKTLIHKGPVNENQESSTLKWQPYSKELILKAKQENKPILLDFYADWCLACQELNYQTFNDSEISKELENFVLIKFNATDNSPELEELRKKYSIVGLPWVVFYDRKGNLRSDLTLTEFEKSEKFKTRISKILTE